MQVLADAVDCKWLVLELSVCNLLHQQVMIRSGQVAFEHGKHHPIRYRSLLNKGLHTVKVHLDTGATLLECKQLRTVFAANLAIVINKALLSLMEQVVLTCCWCVKSISGALK